jgi:hypothetical protein
MACHDDDANPTLASAGFHLHHGCAPAFESEIIAMPTTRSCRHLIAIFSTWPCAERKSTGASGGASIICWNEYKMA